jgi:hypothetical protein
MRNKLLVLLASTSFGSTLTLAIIFYSSWLTGKVWSVGKKDFSAWPGMENTPDWYILIELYIEPFFILVVLGMSLVLLIWHIRRSI